VANLLSIGAVSHPKIANVEWTHSFPELESYDALIIDLTSFPREDSKRLFKNIAILKRAARIFIRDSKEIFCIMEKPLRIPLKRIPLNYSWVPFPQKLTVTPMLLGKTIIPTDERFRNYIKNVGLWFNELHWEKTAHCSFVPVAVNKSKKPVAATLTIGGRGRIHFLPKATKISPTQALNILVELADRREPGEHSWLTAVEVPEINVGELRNFGLSSDSYRNLFSVDHRKVVQTVQLVLEDLGVPTVQTGVSLLSGLKGDLLVYVASTKEKVEMKSPILEQLAKHVENRNRNEKIIFVVNTYRDLPPSAREDMEHLDVPARLYVEVHDVAFLTTLSLYNLWRKVLARQISTTEASILLHNEKGEIRV